MLLNIWRFETTTAERLTGSENELGFEIEGKNSRGATLPRKVGFFKFAEETRNLFILECL